MADSILVSQNTATTCGLSQTSNSNEDSIDTTVGREQNTPDSAKTSSDSLQIIRQSFQSRGLSNDVIEIIMQTWRESTRKQYWSYIQNWLCFCAERQINSMSPTVNSVLEFLARLFHSGIGYSGLNTARSALSTFISIDGVVSLGKHVLVKRFMRGIFIMKPSLSRYNFTWNVSDLLKYLAKLENDKLILKQLTFKLSALLALIVNCSKTTIITIN
jgi:hypothetical protein